MGVRKPNWSRRTRTADREAQRLERILEHAEVLVDEGEDDEAIISALEALPPGPFIESSFHLRAGDCYRIGGALDEAEEHYRAALELDPKCADALHGVGLIQQERGEFEAMVKTWLEVRKLDQKMRPYPWTLSEREFEAAVEATLAEIPEETRRRFENLPIIATDYPSQGLIEDGVDPRSLGIITGVPYSEKLSIGTGADLDCVQLYQKNIERMCHSKDEVIEEIRITVLHETGHYFGLSDDDLDDIGLG
jgi:predicted Zn-dependent protease with MMP-like domain